jgi:hypothetical protein
MVTRLRQACVTRPDNGLELINKFNIVRNWRQTCVVNPANGLELINKLPPENKW